MSRGNSRPDRKGPKRRTVLKGITAATALTASSGLAASAEVNPGDQDPRFDIVADKLLASSRGLEAAKGSLSRKQQSIIGESIAEHADNLLDDLEKKGLFETASVDREDLTTGRAFESWEYDPDAEETGEVLILPSRKGRNMPTEISYTVSQSSAEGRMDEETELTIVVVPEHDEAYATIAPTQVPEPDTDSSIFGFANYIPFLGSTRQRLEGVPSRIIKPGTDLRRQVNDEHLEEVIDTNDVTTLGRTWTYCLQGPVGSCLKRRVQCTGNHCSESTVDSCYCGQEGVEFIPLCQTAEMGDCVVRRNPCGENRVRCP